MGISKSKNKQFNTAVYIRLSREDGDKEESNSISNQKMMLCDYVKSQEDLSLFDVYCDDGFTGTNFDRPAFKRMIEDIANGFVHCVIVKDLSRFGRNYIDVGNYIENYFIDKDIRFIALNDNIDSLRSQYDMLLPIRNIFNQQYSLDISKKVQSTFKAKQKDGQFIGAFTSYGYNRSTLDKHKLITDDYAADVVIRIFRLYAEGIGKIRIANILNEDGILCPSEYKRQCGLNYRNSNKKSTTDYWTYSTIDKILKNQIYHGDMVQGKTKRRMKGKACYLPREEWIVVKGTHPAIIEDELWNCVQKTLERDTRYIDFHENSGVFAGFIKCGDCGRSMSKNRTGGQIYYICNTYKNYGKGYCSSHRLNHRCLEKVILDDLNSFISSIQDLESMVNKKNREQLMDEASLHKALKEYDTKLIKLMKNKKEAYEDYRDGLISREEYIQYKSECESKINLLSIKKEELSQKKKEVNMYSPWIQRLLDIRKIEALDKEIVDEMINAIYVYQDEVIRIVYNFSNELESLITAQSCTTVDLA